MKALQIIESAYRCTVEEQDDPAVWIAHAMNNAGAEIGILLKGNAVNYAVKDQDASGLSFGGITHPHPPRLEDELNRFGEKGVPVFVVREDIIERGINPSELIENVELLNRGVLPNILSTYDQVWHW